MAEKKYPLKRDISRLREIIIKDFARILDKIGFDINGDVVKEVSLSQGERDIKERLLKIEEIYKASSSDIDFLQYIEDSSRTILHILLAFKTMEARGLMPNLISELLGELRNDLEILPDFKKADSYAYLDFCDKFEDEIEELENKFDSYEDDEYYKFIYLIRKMSKQMAEAVPLLFKDLEHTLIYPDFVTIKEIFNILSNIPQEEYLKDDFLGWVYQYWVDVKDSEIKTADKDKKIGFSELVYARILKRLEEEQTQFGEFYTPKWVVKYIVDNTLKPYWEENKKIEEIKLLDPACGAGNFLVYSFDLFYDLWKNEHPELPDNTIINNILQKNIHGVDIQAQPLQITALNLWLKAKKKAQDVKIENMNLFKMNVLKASSLYRYENEKVDQLSLFETAVLEEEKAYKSEDIGQYINAQNKLGMIKAKQFFSQKFEIIVMNPPYLDLSAASRKFKGTESYNKIREMHLFLQKNYPKNSNNIFASFVERVNELVRKNGYVGLIGSDTFMNLPTLANVRESILKNTIDSMIHLGEGIFEGPVVNAVILLYKVKPNNSKTLILVEDKRHIPKNDKSLMTGREYKVKQKDFFEIVGYPFAYNISEKLRSLFNSKLSLGLEKNGIAEIRPGAKLKENEEIMKYKWEVPCDYISNNQWVALNKGGDYSKYLTESFLVIPWADNYQNQIIFDNILQTLKNKKMINTNIGVKNEDLMYSELLNIFDNDKLEYVNIEEFMLRKDEILSVINKYNPNLLLSKYPNVELRNHSYYFKNGITYGSLSSKGFSSRLLDDKKVLEISGPGIFMKNSEDSNVVLAYLNSKFNKFMLNIINPTVNFQRGDLEKLPWIYPSSETREKIESSTLSLINNKLFIASFKYTSEFYKSSEIGAFLTQKNILDAFINYKKDLEEKEIEIEKNEFLIDEEVFNLYEITPEDRDVIEEEFGKSAYSYAKVNNPETLLSKEELESLYCVGKPTVVIDEENEEGLITTKVVTIDGKKQTPLSVIEIAEFKQMNPEDVLALRIKYGIYRDKDLLQAILNWLRAIVKDSIKETNKLYLDEDIEKLIKQQIEEKYSNGSTLIDEIESICAKPLIDIVRAGLKIGSSATMFGADPKKGSKDTDEPLLQQNFLAGTGASRIVVFWFLQDFLLEFEPDKKYTMQNEIRRIKERLESRLLDMQSRDLSGLKTPEKK